MEEMWFPWGEDSLVNLINSSLQLRVGLIVLERVVTYPRKGEGMEGELCGWEGENVWVKK